MFSLNRAPARRRPRFSPSFDMLSGRVLPSDFLGTSAPPETGPLEVAPLEWRDYCAPIFTGGDGEGAGIDPTIDPALLPATTI